MSATGIVFLALSVVMLGLGFYGASVDVVSATGLAESIGQMKNFYFLLGGLMLFIVLYRLALGKASLRVQHTMSTTIRYVILIGVGVFMVYPLVDVFVYSFEEGYNSASQTFSGVGLFNYRYVLRDPYFLQALKNTFILVIITVPVSTGLALLISFALGLFAAWKTMGTTSRIKGLLDSVFTIPMVLPPTVCGFLLLMLFGRSTGVGQWLIAHGISVVFTWPAAVISAVVVSFPLVYRTALGAFESLDTQMLDAARTLGWSERRIFTRLMMPLGWPSIAAGTVLAFARAMGEFGCTLFFAGNYAGITQTIPIAIYFEWMGGNTSVALFWVVVVIAFSFLVILFINMYTAHSQKYRERGLSRAERKQAKDLAGQGDSLDPAGGDALRIDREALVELMRDDAAPQGGR